MTDLMDLSVTDLAAVIREGKASPSEAIESALARAEAKGAGVRMRDGREVPPLLGVPDSAKDVIPTRGVRTTYGSRLHENDVPSLEALAITRMRNAGAILIGKTTTSEFGHKPLTEAPLFGRTLNPWDARATCGGSSGGRRWRCAPEPGRSRSAPMAVVRCASPPPAAAWSG